MQKPDDRWVDELAADIRKVVSCRYAKVEEADFGRGPAYTRSGAAGGTAFASLPRKDQLALIVDDISWKRYEDRGIGAMQSRVIIGNVVDGKPQEKWLEGAFDEAVLEKERIAGFKALLASDKKNGYQIEDADGNYHYWKHLSYEGKLIRIAYNAAYYDLPFEPFVKAVRDEHGSGRMTAREVAALRLVLRAERELHALAKMLPDDGRTEATPLVEQVKDLLDYVSDLETNEVKQRRGGQEPFKESGNVGDGNRPDRWLEGTSFVKGSEQVDEARAKARSLGEQFQQMLNDPTPGPAQRSEGKEPEKKSDRGIEI